MALVTIRIIETITVNTETNEVTSSKVIENGEGIALESVKPTKVKKAPKEKTEGDLSSPLVKLEEGKLVLNPAAQSMLGLTAGDRVAINYVEVEGVHTPVISKSGVYGDPNAGNKLTKAGTVSFKGAQSATLGGFGSNFNLIHSSNINEGALILEDPNAQKLEVITDDMLSKMETPKAIIQKEHPAMNVDFSDSPVQLNLENQEEDLNFTFDL